MFLSELPNPTSLYLYMFADSELMPKKSLISGRRNVCGGEKPASKGLEDPEAEVVPNKRSVVSIRLPVSSRRSELQKEPIVASM